MNDLAQQVIRLNRINHHLAAQRGEARAVAAQGVQIGNEITELNHTIDLYTRANAVLTRIGEDRQDQAQRQIEALVTQGLQTIFGDDLSFHLTPVVRANRPEVDFSVRSSLGDHVLETDLRSRGGGLEATVGFLLQLVVLLLSRDRQEPVLGLDETFAFLSEDKLPLMALFLRELADKTGVQIILVTHTPVLAEHADKIYRLTQTNGVTTVNQV